MSQKQNQPFNIAVGQKVVATFESIASGVVRQSSGKVTEVGGPIGQPENVLATVMMDDGRSFTMPAMFFMKTMNIVGEMA